MNFLKAGKIVVDAVDAQDMIDALNIVVSSERE
jgi:hypothetical protein